VRRGCWLAIRYNRTSGAARVAFGTVLFSLAMWVVAAAKPVVTESNERESGPG
jgi:uncharacterized membrane protein YhdT